MQNYYEDTILDPNTIAGKLYILLKEVNFSRIFYSQEEIRLAYGEKYPDEPTPKQPTISKALKQISQQTFEFERGNKTEIYTFLDFGSSYGFIKCHWRFINLFDEDFQFHRDSIFLISNNAIVFSLAERDVKRFAESISTLFPPDLFWGISLQGNHVFLMFNKHSFDYDKYHDDFVNFFEKFDDYCKKTNYRRKAALRMRNPRKKTEEKRRLEEENR